MERDKYNLDEEVDDEQFLANRPDYNRPASGAVADFQRKQQLMLKEQQRLQSKCIDSTKNSLRLIDESEEIGVKTGAELLEQKEKLGRIDANLDNIAGQTRKSHKHIKELDQGMYGVLLRCTKSIFKRKKSPEDSQSDQKIPSSLSTSNLKQSPLDDTIERLHDARQYATSGVQSDQIYQKKQNKNDFDSVIDDSLIQMQSGIGRLKELAIGLGREIDEQNESLDVIVNKVEKTDVNIQVQNKAMLKHLKK